MPDPTRRKVHPLPVLAATFAVFGCAILPLSIVAILLGVISLIRLADDPQKRGGRGLAITAITMGGLTIPLAAVLSASLIPSFLEYQGRSKQTECKTTLAQMFQAQAQFFEQNRRYAQTFKELGWRPPAENLYAYFLAPGSGAPTSVTAPGPQQPAETRLEEDSAIGTDTRKHRFPKQPVLHDAMPKALGGNAVLGVSGECPACVLTVACVAQLDGDPILDVWSVSSASRKLQDGAQVAAGELLHENDDALLPKTTFIERLLGKDEQK